MIRSLEAICLGSLLLIGLSNLFFAATWGAIRLFGNGRTHSSLAARERMLIASIFLPIVFSVTLTSYSVWTALTCNDVLKESRLIGPCVHLARHLCLHLDSARLALAPVLRVGELVSIGLLLAFVGIALWMRQTRRIRWMPVQQSRKLVKAWKAARRRFSHPEVRLEQVLDCPSGAALVGWQSPSCLVSTWLVRHASPLELEVVLKHELAHAKRGDNLKRVLMKLGRGFSLFSPAGGALCTEWERTAEFICDELAVQDKHEAAALAHALLITLTRATSSGASELTPGPMPVSALILPQKSIAFDRIERLVHYQPTVYAADSREWLFGFGLFVCLTVVSALLAATLHCAAETLMRLPIFFWLA